MNDGLWLVTVLLNGVITVRLLLFKAKRGQQRRWLIGLLAWVLIVFNAAFALHVVLGWVDTGPGPVALLALLAGLIMRARGNVARLAG